MFYYLQGPITILEPSLAVVDCGGVGYSCAVTAYTAAQLKLNQNARLYVHENIREGAFDLFGFASREELRCFQLLLGVNGVGPKAALAILSAGGPQSFTLAVMTGDEKALTVAQGIGKKIAQRIILELKDKLAKGQISPGGESYGGTGVTVIPENKSSEAAAALAGVDPALPVQEMIRLALQGIGRRR